MRKLEIAFRIFEVVKLRFLLHLLTKKVVWGVVTSALVLSLLPVNNAYAAANYQINYQGKLTDSANATVADGDYDIVFSLYTASTGGVAIWTESHTGANDVTVTNGLFSVMLGSITSLSTVNFNQTLYLGVTIEADSEMTPRKTLGAVPAAFQADMLDGLDSTDFLSTSTASAPKLWSLTGLGNIGSSTASTTVLGNLAAAGNTIVQGLFSAYQQVTAPYFVATSTTASVLPYASSTAISVSGAGFFDKLGVASSSLSANHSLVVSGNAHFGGTITATSTATSTFSGPISLTKLHTSATSTGTNGFDISAGCYAINGTCISGGGGSGTVSSGLAGQLAYYSADGTTVSGTTTGVITAGTFVATTSTASILPYASSTGLTVSGSAFLATEGGNVGIGTTTSSQALTVEGSTARIAIYDNGSLGAGKGGGIFFQHRNGNNIPFTYASIQSSAGSGTPGNERGDLVFNTANVSTLSEKMRLTNVGNLGIGTTSPGANFKLSVAGGNVHIGGTITATSTATSTFSGPISLTKLHTSATSTGTNGFDISAGCYAINGTCISGGGGSGTVSSGLAGQLAYYASDGTTVTGTTTGVITAGTFVATTSTASILPYASTTAITVSGTLLDITGSSGIIRFPNGAATKVQFMGSANGDTYSIAGAANALNIKAPQLVQFGTSAAVSQAYFNTINGSLTLAGNLTVSSTTATSTFAAPVSVTKIVTSATSTGTNGFDISAGCYAINGTCISGGSGSGTVNSGDIDYVAYYSATGTSISHASGIKTYQFGGYRGTAVGSPVYMTETRPQGIFEIGSFATSAAPSYSGWHDALSINAYANTGDANSRWADFVIGGANVDGVYGHSSMRFFTRGNETNPSVALTIEPDKDVVIVGDLTISGNNLNTGLLNGLILNSNLTISGGRINNSTSTIISSALDNGNGDIGGTVIIAKGGSGEAPDDGNGRGGTVNIASGGDGVTAGDNGARGGTVTIVAGGLDGGGATDGNDGTVNIGNGSGQKNAKFNLFGGLRIDTSSTTAFYINNGTTRHLTFDSTSGALGLGTSSPSANYKLSVAGNIHLGGTITATSTATSTFSGPISLTKLHTSATSTGTNGFDISAGCYAIRGTCISGGVGGSGTVSSGLAGQLAYYASDGTTVTGTTTGVITAGTFVATTSTASVLPYASTTAISVSGSLWVGGSTGNTNKLVSTGDNDYIAHVNAATSFGGIRLFQTNDSTFNNAIGQIQAIGTSYAGDTTRQGDLEIQSYAATGGGSGNVTMQIAGGNVGIGTTSPSFNYKLVIAGGGLHVGGTITATSTATSTFSGPISLTKLHTSATSTGTNGFDISAGCYAINGTCISGGAATSPAGNDTYVQFNDGGVFGGVAGFTFEKTPVKLTVTHASTSKLSITGGFLDFTASDATSTIKHNSPYAWTLATSTSQTNPFLRVDTTANAEQIVFGLSSGDVIIGGVGQATNLVFEESSSINAQGTGTLTFGVTGDLINFAVPLGIGTTSPSTNFKLIVAGGNAHFGGTITATSTATSTFSGPISLTKLHTSATSTGTNGFDISAGCYAINGTCVGGGSGSGTVNSGTIGGLAYYTGSTAVSSAGTSLYWDNTNKTLGIATTTQTGYLFSRFINGGNPLITGGPVFDATTTYISSGVSDTTQRNGGTVYIARGGDNSGAVAAAGNGGTIHLADGGDHVDPASTAGIGGIVNMVRGGHDDNNTYQNDGSVNIGNSAGLKNASLNLFGGLRIDSSSTTAFYINNDTTRHLTFDSTSGSLGLGTSSPSVNYKLSVAGNVHLGGTITSTSTATSTFMGTLNVMFRNTATTNGVCHSGSDLDDIDTTTIYSLVACSSAPGDIAEFYPTQSEVEAGDIVATTEEVVNYEAEGADPVTGQIKPLGEQELSILKKASSGDIGVLGVVSTGPFQTFGKDVRKSGHDTQPVALVGRVPVKVNLEGGPIKPGDKVALSSTPGVGMKADANSPVTVGTALSSFNENSDQDENGVGRITVFIDLSHAKLSSAIAGGNLVDGLWGLDETTGQIKAFAALDLAGQDINNVGAIKSASGNWSISADGVLTTKEIRTEKLCLGTVCVDENDLRELLNRTGIGVTETFTSIPDDEPTNSDNENNNNDDSEILADENPVPDAGETATSSEPAASGDSENADPELPTTESEPEIIEQPEITGEEEVEETPIEEPVPEPEPPADEPAI